MGNEVQLSPRAGFVARITADGARVLGPGGDTPTLFDMAVVGLRRSEGVERRLPAGEVEIEGVEVWRHLGSGVREWWRALPSGLEHGVTLFERPEGTSNLHVDIEVAGLEVRAAGDAAVFVDSHGRPVATYSGLFAFDARGRPIAASMETRGDQVRFVVNDAAAEYPITIDPLLVMEEALLLPRDADGGDLFGSSVALDQGSTVRSSARIETTTPPASFLGAPACSFGPA
jgi:hypothetical protein